MGKEVHFPCPVPQASMQGLKFGGVGGGDRRWRQRTGAGGACVHSCFPLSCGDGGQVLIPTGWV